jgi:histidine triad (HIT) family protein
MQELSKEQKEQVRSQCIFCQIADGKIPSKKVYEDEKVLAILDINPANPGHILLLPKEHFSIMPQMDDEIVFYLSMICKKLSQVLLKSLQAQGTTIFSANGSAAGQKAPHFMIHIIPRTEGDEVGLIPEIKKISGEDRKKIQESVLLGLKKSFGNSSGKEVKTSEPVGSKNNEKSLEKRDDAGVTNPELDNIADFLTK